MQRNSTIGELMERKRIQDGAKEYQGHTYMDLARFDDATKHMIIFDVLTDESPVGWKGEGEAIAERVETADQKRENPSALHSCRNVGDLFERANPLDR